MDIVSKAIFCWLGVLVILWESWENSKLWLNLDYSSLWDCIISFSCLETVLDVESPGPFFPLEISEDLAWSNHINLEGIHSFLSSVERKEEPLFQSNIFLNPNFGVKILLSWFCLAAHTMKCLSVVSPQTVRKMN